MKDSRYPRSELLGETVRIWDGPRLSVRAEGKLIAVIPEPVLVVEDVNGVRHYESPNLPIEVQETNWRRV